MAYAGIDANALRVALNNCESAINSSNSIRISSALSNDSIWFGDAKNNLRRSLSNLDILYSNLRDTLRKYKSVADDIDKYKRCESTISNLESEKTRIEPNLYYEEKGKGWAKNYETGKWYEYETTVTKKNEGIQRRLNEIAQQISYNKNEMSNLERSIASKL